MSSSCKRLPFLSESTRAALLQTVKSDPSIAAVAASWPGGIGGNLAEATSAITRVPIDYKLVSPEYFALLDVEVVTPAQ